MAQPDHGAHAQRPLGRSFLIALAVLVTLVAFILLCAALGLVPDHFIAFLFLLNWSTERLEQSALPAVCVGSFTGLGLAAALIWLVGAFGESAGGLAFLALLVPVITLQVAGRARLFINHSTMVILTVTTITHVLIGADFTHLAFSLALGILVFGGGATLYRRFFRRSTQQA